MSLFADDVIVYLENLKESTKNLLELISKFSKITEYKVNIQKSVVSQHTNNEHVQMVVKNTIPFIVTQKEKEIFRCKSNKTCIELYDENQKTLMKEMEELNEETYRVHGLEKTTQ